MTKSNRSHTHTNWTNTIICALVQFSSRRFKWFRNVPVKSTPVVSHRPVTQNDSLEGTDGPGSWVSCRPVRVSDQPLLLPLLFPVEPLGGAARTQTLSRAVLARATVSLEYKIRIGFILMEVDLLWPLDLQSPLLLTWPLWLYRYLTLFWSNEMHVFVFLWLDVAAEFKSTMWKWLFWLFIQYVDTQRTCASHGELVTMC